MVRWYHAIFSTYGFWLPNDPRGSWSDFVGAWELFHFGGTATKVDFRRSYAHDRHDGDARRRMKDHLLFPPVRFDDAMRAAVAAGLAHACEEFSLDLYACAIGYDHVHIVAGRSERSIEQTVAVLKSRATRQLGLAGIHPLLDYRNSKGVTPTPWSEGCWKVFINDERQLHQAIAYVQRHPMKEGLPAQPWSFLKPV